jgi:glycosyltransferase involved in cell wall biosynthesis
MTSEFENCPMVILESKVRGIPCVAPNVGGIPEIVLDGFDGILYKKYDLHEIKQAIETIRANYVYYMNNSLRESKKYSFEEISEYWLHLFTSI